MRSIDKTVILMASNIINSVNVLLLSILFARMLSKTNYGTYIQMNMLIQPLVLILALGLPSSLNYFLPKNYNRRYLILRTLGVLVLVGIISWLLLTVFSRQIGIFLNNRELEEYIRIAGACVLCSLCFQIIRPILMYRSASITLAIINVGRTLLFFVAMMTCLIARTTMATLFMVFAFIYGVDFIIAIVIIGKDAKLYEGDSLRYNITLTDQFKYAVPLALVEIFWLIGREIDKYIVSHYMSPGDLAVYSRGAVELPLVHIFASTIAQVYLPKWVRLWDTRSYNSLIVGWHATIKKTALIMFPMFVLFQIIGRDLIVLLYSANYIDSAIIFTVYLFQVPLQITAYSAIVQASGNNRFILYGYIGQIAFNIVLSVYMIKLLGAIGPAIVTVSSMYLWTFYMIFVIGRIFGTTLKNIFPWKYLVKVLLVSFAAGFAPLLLIGAWQSGIVRSVGWTTMPECTHFIKILMLTVSYVASYGFLLFKLQILDRDDKETIYRWLMLKKIAGFLRRLRS